MRKARSCGIGRGRRSSRAISRSSLLATVVVVVIVVVVSAGLYASFLPSTSDATPHNQVTVQNATLLSGSASAHSLTTACQGDAILEVQLYNPSSATIHITSVTLLTLSSSSSSSSSSSPLSSNSNGILPLLTLSNSCLDVNESVPTLDPGQDYVFNGYSPVPLYFGDPYVYVIKLDNGQTINQTLLAQAE
jgi:hypothetical protein